MHPGEARLARCVRRPRYRVLAAVAAETVIEAAGKVVRGRGDGSRCGIAPRRVGGVGRRSATEAGRRRGGRRGRLLADVGLRHRARPAIGGVHRIEVAFLLQTDAVGTAPLPVVRC